MTKGKQNADAEIVSDRLQQMGLQFDNNDNLRIQAMMAFGMFDTELSHRYTMLAFQLTPERQMLNASSLSSTISSYFTHSNINIGIVKLIERQQITSAVLKA